MSTARWKTTIFFNPPSPMTVLNVDKDGGRENAVVVWDFKDIEDAEDLGDAWEAC